MQSIVEADRTILEQLLGQEATTRLVELDNAIQARKPMDKKTPPVLLGIISDRQKRGTIHGVSLVHFKRSVSCC